MAPIARPGWSSEEEADPALCARAAFVLAKPRAEKAGVDLRLHGGGLDRVVRCSPGALRRVLVDLCERSLRSLGAGPGAVTVRITEPVRGTVRVVFDDTGPASPETEREKVVAGIRAACGCEASAGDAEGGGARFTMEFQGA
jgi:signal transduction histidine kinase